MTTFSGTTRAASLLIFLTILNILNFADRFLLQGFAVDMTADLKLSKLEFTLLTGFVFTGFYTCLGLVMGALADRVHRPRLMAAGVAAWSALTGLTALTGNFAQLAFCRLFVGVGEATLTPAALGLLGDVWDARRRASVSGVYYLGAPVGIGLAFIIAGTLGAVIGWRQCFIALGVLGAGLSLLLLLVREPRTSAHAITGASRSAPSQVMRDIAACLKASPALCLVILGGVLVIYAQGALVLDQLWLVQERGFGKQQAQNVSGVIFLIGGVVGALSGGYAADLMESRRPGGRLQFLVLVYLLGIPVAYFFRLADPSSVLFLPAMLLCSVLLTVGYGPLFAIVQDLAPDRLRSTMTAFLILCMTLLGTSPGNLQVGWLTDLYQAQGLAEPITHAVLVGMLPWVAAVPCFYFAGRLVRKAAKPCPAA
ncbi:MFS transporter [Massilia sp. CF038]|uniref:MFS transporter n=1 Tax=Massilia sp. CF038 TaxID=1881045 RepID=UPI0009232355|nr:MFS transporter [Massilia sp. CF038]SHH22637.1 Sugar phosphate permease [Massilia sp. CF038]